jgi:hypothetical protein
MWKFVQNYVDVDHFSKKLGLKLSFVKLIPGEFRPHVEGGHDAEKAVDLLKTFYKGENPNAPEEKRKPART